MTDSRRRFAHRPYAWQLLATALLALAPLLAQAQRAGDYPNRPIRLIVAYPPGGPVDIVGRTIAQAMSESLGQQIVVDNRSGASGIVGSEVAAKSPADGYTLLLASSAHSIHPSLYPKLPYDVSKDFVMVGSIASAPFVLVTGPAVPAQNVQQLIAYLKSKPGELSYASPGSGSPNHLSAELMRVMTGTNVIHVPYRGAAPAETDVMGGQVVFLFDSIPSALPLVRSGRLRALAVTSAKRSSAAPDIPTMAESGLPGFETLTWYGLMAPAGTPPDIVKRLNTELNKALQTADMKERMAKLGMDPMIGPPEAFAAFFNGEAVKWAKIVKDSGAKVD